MTEVSELALPVFNFDNTFARTLEPFFVSWKAAEAQSPRLLQFNQELANELGLDAGALNTEAGAAIFSGNEVPTGSTPLAQVYAGHQFGGFSPQLGDGRALLLGEVIDSNGRRRDIQLKGSGKTPFSRGGDGKAALGPVLREYLIGEAMHALGIPTTRALAAVTTGEEIYRETVLPGAVLTRVASSHIRVGTFQYFAARQDTKNVKTLADYCIERHYPQLKDNDNPYLAFFDAVADVQSALVAKWMGVGFIHGVMNTDNMTISGETIDYGPCAFMDAYSPKTVFSSIDTHGRYAFGNQPSILVWNLARLAETLIPLIDPDTDQSVNILTERVSAIPSTHESYWLSEMAKKLGIQTATREDDALIKDFLTLLNDDSVDFSLAFRTLSGILRKNKKEAEDLYKNTSAFDEWVNRWTRRLKKNEDSPEQIADAIDQINPIYIPRNHMVEAALAAAVDATDMTLFSKLLSAITKPYDEVADASDYSLPAPKSDVPYQTFCGT
ncbi:MAG: YdiU family protein [Pseudomonadota bacterium]|nr:YdiU family protein [Pseudomonadota bacterium]